MPVKKDAQEEFDAQLELLFRFANNISLLPLRAWKEAFKDAPEEDKQQILEVINAAIPLQEVMLSIVLKPKKKGPQSDHGADADAESVSL